MGTTNARLVAWLAELLWVGTVSLFFAAMSFQAGGMFAMWGLGCSAAAAAATVCAVQICTTTKVLQRMARVERRLVGDEAEAFLRGRQEL